jgi:hypothetical protein
MQCSYAVICSVSHAAYAAYGNMHILAAFDTCLLILIRSANEAMAGYTHDQDHVQVEATPAALSAAGFVFDAAQVAALVAHVRHECVSACSRDLQQGLEGGREQELSDKLSPTASACPPAQPLLPELCSPSSSRGVATAELPTPLASAFAQTKYVHRHVGHEGLMLVIAKQRLELNVIRNEKKRLQQSSRRALSRDSKRPRKYIGHWSPCW